ncbi:hypothetical protein E1281_26660 [Actinomadura sp. KC345]|uniref:hypothetical protein n=1 Tax=Actinomadura sp. KC345 TaxID=2530371 RepID=UPI00104AD9B6|nr:hypothetical protein [Actinomadura sp. KC345]TDC47161.1 hypothetical protein E1281_26660 [Actinomadura sp. KC345]
MSALDDLYDAFADVPHPVALDGCPCCVAPGEGRPLLARPPRVLTAEDLARYAAKAMSTWGGPEEFRYFAPRLMELAAEDAFGWPDVEVVFRKLGQAQWQDWPQRDAVVAFFHAFWTRTLASHPARPSAATALCALAGAEPDMSHYLDEWGALASEPALRHLHAFVSEELVWRRGRPWLSNAFWDVSSAAYRQVMEWLTGGPAYAAVSAAFGRTEDEPALRLLAAIEEQLRPTGDTVTRPD